MAREEAATVVEVTTQNADDIDIVNSSFFFFSLAYLLVFFKPYKVPYASVCQNFKDLDKYMYPSFISDDSK